MTDVPSDALRVLVKYDERTYHYEHDGEQYGSWSESRSFSVKGARVVDENYIDGYNEEIYRVPAGTGTVYVLVMHYSTGDSFGSCDGCGAILGCFGSREVALAAEKAIKAQQNDFTIKVKDDFGRQISISNPGAGYFECINSIELEAYVI